MNVRSEAHPGGSGKTIAVELEDNDMRDVDGFDDLPMAVRWRKMTDRADSLLVEWMLRRGDISSEFASQRMNEIKAGTPA